MSSPSTANSQVTRTVLIAAAAAAGISAVSSGLVVFAVAQLLRTTPARSRSHKRHSRVATRPSTTSFDVEAAPARRQSSLFAWCLRRLSGRVASSSSESDAESTEDGATAAVTVLPGPLTSQNTVQTARPTFNPSVVTASAAAAAVGEKDPLTASRRGARRSTLGSKAPRAYHTHEGGIITQYMDATARLETDDYFKKNATQRRDTVALTELRERRRSVALAKPGMGAMDLAVFNGPVRAAATPSAGGGSAVTHPVASMLAEVGLDDAEGGGGAGGRRASTSLSLLSASAAMPLPQNPIYRIVITGGPCSGKSTSMVYLKEAMERVGYTVYLVPEVATLLMTGGARLWLTPEEAKEEEEEEDAKAQRAAIIRTYQERIAKLEMVMAAAHNDSEADDDDGTDLVRLPTKNAEFSSHLDSEYGGAAGGTSEMDSTAAAASAGKPRLSRKKITMQRVVLQLMMMLEDSFYELAAMRGKPSVIFYDRGTMDASAYCTDPEWAEILRVTGYTDEELRDTRYDAVVHMVTAALGAEAYYTLENNATRYETSEQAITQDMATRDAWRGHFLFYVCDNSTNFETKLERVAAFVRKVIGATPATTLLSADESESHTSSLGASGGVSPSHGPTDLQELAYIMTGTRAANKHMLLSPSNSRERSMSPSMGLSGHGTPQSGQLSLPGDSMRLDHSVLFDVNATTVGTTLMPSSGHKLGARPAAAVTAMSPLNAPPPFADNDSNSLHSQSRGESEPPMTPGTATDTDVPAAVSSSCEASEALSTTRPSKRRVTLPPNDLAVAAAAAAMAEHHRHAPHGTGSEASSDAEEGAPAHSPSPSPSPDIPEAARAGTVPSSLTTSTEGGGGMNAADAAGTADAQAMNQTRNSGRHDFGASLTLNADDLHHQDSSHGLNSSAAALHGGAAATFAESAAEGLQRHFMIRKIDMSQIPENAVESEVTLITLVPTRREYVSETIIRVVRGGAAAATRPVYMRRVEFARAARAAAVISSPTTDGEASAAEEEPRSIRNVTTRALSREDFLRLAQFFDPAQPLVRKQVKRFLYGFQQLSVVSFLEPEELRGSSRVMCSAEVSADELPDWIEVEEVSVTGRDVLV